MKAEGAGPAPLLQRGARYLSGLQISIRAKLLLAFFVIIFLLGSTNVLLAVRAFDYKRQYDVLIDNITTANSINGYVKPAIDTTLWDIVKGQYRFEDGKQYQIINDVNQRVAGMMASTDSETGRQMLEIIRRTMGTLEHYVDDLGMQISGGSRYDENVAALDNIRGITELVEESVQEYMLFELNRTGQKYREAQAGFAQWLVTSVIMLGVVSLFSIFMAWLISESIYVPIKKLRDVTTTLTKEDLSVLAAGEHSDEITELGLGFNIMSARIRRLLDEKVKEQENLKKAEMRALQAQINPHFLYNTLDTIIWLAETGQKDTVVELVRSLSSFFRVTLSRGRDWIPLKDEIDHVRAYLAIQKVRYRDILDFRIEADPTVLDGTILKLSLQPLAENALYHGIKNKRSGGCITVRAARAGAESVRLEVEDDGAGIPAERLVQIQRALKGSEAGAEMGEEGYGIFNVHRRLQLFYGEQYGLSIESEFGKGTLVRLLIPYRVE